MEIPFNKPFVGPEERQAVADAVEAGALKGAGPISQRVEKKLCEWLDVEYALLTTSCTHALEMAMMALDVGPGDEVIMPSFTFVSTANAVVLQGATPVFAEIRPETLNLDPADVENKITPRTRAIIPVHYAGVGCDMDAFRELAETHDLALVEDAAQAVDAYYGGEPLGTIGDIGCYSFHATKNITSGEGGAFLTDDPEVAEQAEIIRRKGTNQAAFLRGEVDQYSWVQEGSSYVPSDVLAALLEAQLQKHDEIRRKREEVWRAYHKALTPLADDDLITLPTIPDRAIPNYHIYFVLTDTRERRELLIDALRQNGIPATFHYVPLHSSPYGRNTLGINYDLPVTEYCSNTVLRLPVYPQLADRIGEMAAAVRTALNEVLRGS